ncbi:MAG: class D sortase, partial [Chloroflexota bacterium]|nr:class D sortase [Chloroflexota bacterium]
RKKSRENLSVEELRHLLVEKQRAVRQERLEQFRKTGRVVKLASDLDSSPLNNLRSGPLIDSEDKAPSSRRRVLDIFLLVIEILAVLGLIFVLFNGLEIIQELNQEVARALEQPTLTPTPLIRAVILPSGHIPPVDGVTRPNEAEIPEHLQPLVQSLANVPTPTPGPEQARRIQIPALGVDASIVQGDDWEHLKKGVGQHVGSMNPGDDGNIILSAHNDIFGEIFRHLDELESGDEIFLHTQQRVYTYIVTNTDIVEPTQVEFLDATARPTVTLVTCYPYMVDTQRIVVQAQLKSGGG